MLLECKALLSSNIFHTNLIYFFYLQNSDGHNVSLVNDRGLKLGHFDIFDMLIPVSGILYEKQVT